MLPGVPKSPTNDALAIGTLDLAPYDSGEPSLGG